MHMADGFISPAAGCTMWAASAAMTMLCARKVRQEKEMRLVPLMGVLGAFIFACQMLNFTIPGTGSSGHLGGGLILAILLGPYAGFLVMAAILAVQALFFADGGLLALGCNIFNMGFFSCLVAYPFIYRPLAGKHPGTGPYYAVQRHRRRHRASDGSLRRRPGNTASASQHCPSPIRGTDAAPFIWPSAP